MAAPLLQAVLDNAGAQLDDGWHRFPEDRTVTLHLARQGATTSIPRVAAVRTEGAILLARTQSGATHVALVDDLLTGVVDSRKESSRSVGFGSR